MMTLGTGIGGVAVVEGKLLHGKHAQAGCLGGTFQRYSMDGHAFVGPSAAQRLKQVAGHFP